MSKKRVYTCEDNDSHVFCDIGDSGDVDYGRKKVLNWAHEEKVSEEHIEYLMALNEKALMNYLAEFFMLQF